MYKYLVSIHRNEYSDNLEFTHEQEFTKKVFSTMVKRALEGLPDYNFSNDDWRHDDISLPFVRAMEAQGFEMYSPTYTAIVGFEDSLTPQEVIARHLSPAEAANV